MVKFLSALLAMVIIAPASAAPSNDNVDASARALAKLPPARQVAILGQAIEDANVEKLLDEVCGALFVADAKLRANDVDMEVVEKGLSDEAQMLRSGVEKAAATGDGTVDIAVLTSMADNERETAAKVALERASDSRWAEAGDQVIARDCPAAPAPSVAK